MKRWVLLLLFAGLLAAETGQEVEITAEPHHKLVFANDRVRVLEVAIPPHSETLMHLHRHDYIYVTLGRSQVVNSVKGKEPVRVDLQDGQTGFLPGGFAHFARNLADTPYRNVTVEFLQDEKFRQSQAHQDAALAEEDRGLDILDGGTKEILFVKDGVQVSEFDLQPHAVIPAHSPSHPVLLIPVSDLDLFTRDLHAPGSAKLVASPRHLHAGESIWLAHGFARSLVNDSQHPVTFVTLEFR
jgi:quercetin dioxygenase-like cupin family protein